MPLIMGKSPSSFSKNVATEYDAGKPLKQSLAIAYAMKKKAQQEEMAKGGMMCAAHGAYACHMCHGGKMMAEGGEIEDPEDYDMVGRIMSNRYPKDEFEHEEDASGYLPMPEEREMYNSRAMKEDDRDLNQHGEHEVAAQDMEEDNESEPERMIEHPVENQDDHEDMVGRIMEQRMQHYSEGGRVANDTPPDTEFEDNQFDDLVKRDDLEQHYTGENSGDEIGNEHLDELTHDLIERIMKSRAKRDRNPVPA